MIFQQLESRQRNALLTFLFFMADSKYAHENGHQSNSTTLAGHTRTHYSNPNASLPPNSTMQTLRSHMMHKAPKLQHSSQISAITPGGVSREKIAFDFPVTKMFFCSLSDIQHL